VDLKSLSLKRAYSSDFDDILYDFYIPALKHSYEYYRLAGFFSSTSLAVSARGILGLIKNGGAMRLIISPRLSKDDLDVILKTHQGPERLVEQRFLEELDQLEDDFARDHVSALGWMVANRRLRIKVALPFNSSDDPLTFEEAEQLSLFHQKVGILRDSEQNTISFSGSVNETATGWLNNIEEFKVFRSWEPTENYYVKADFAKFNRFWTDQSRRVRVFEIPRAVENKLIDIAPTDIEKIDLERHYEKARRKERKVNLFQHQLDAVDAWLSDNMTGIFAMATGTGKTFAALGCLAQASRVWEKILVIITCPYQHLVQQWNREIKKFGVKYDQLIIADGTNRGWRDETADTLMDISLGYKTKAIVLTTHNTISSDDFIGIIRKYKAKFKAFIIADEVHGLGSPVRQKGLINEYDLRLGLSATPRRWFDTTGTKAIYDFFGGEVFRFGLEDAINTLNPATGETYLVPYRYLPRFAFLNAEEMEQYAEKTRRIAKLASRQESDDERDKYLEMLLFARADIIKNASEKYKVLNEIFDEINPPIQWTIVYCSPQQIDRVMDIINKRRIIAHRFTMEEKTIPAQEYDGLSERDYLLKNFGEGKYQSLVAMKCLDEGVDVPPARTAILMASSGNPREYIQRIGRVIRRYPGKSEATIYDLIVLPSLGSLPGELIDIERRIIEKELRRYEEISRIAINNAEALAVIADTLESITE
jgi:superfamily II DNA or RNA helicase